MLKHCAFINIYVVRCKAAQQHLPEERVKILKSTILKTQAFCGCRSEEYYFVGLNHCTLGSAYRSCAAAPPGGVRENQDDCLICPTTFPDVW